MRLKRAALFVHRWMGVMFCLLFAWWFLSGIFMMYWDFPEVTEEQRLERAQPLDLSRVARSPQQAWAALAAGQEPAGVALAMFDGRPVYRFRIDGGEQMVYADDARPVTEFPREMRDRVASAWTGQPALAARVEPVQAVDQWTVGGTFRSLQPLWKYTWPDGEEVYVSEATGEVAQYTTRSSRIGAYLGAIPHWLYFTPLRKNGRLPDRHLALRSGNVGCSVRTRGRGLDVCAIRALQRSLCGMEARAHDSGPLLWPDRVHLGV